MLKGKNGETCWPTNQNPKTPKPTKNEDPEKVREDLSNSDLLEWLQEFWEKLVDDEILLQGGSHASSSHEPSLEPTPARSADLGKHYAFSHFPKDRNCEICQRTKITRAPCRRCIGTVRTSCWKFWWLDYSRSQSSQWRVWISKNHRYAVVVQDLATQWIQSYPCKTKTSEETERSLQKLLELGRKPKVIYTDNALEFWKGLWRSLLEQLYVNTTQIRNKWDFWESRA